MKNDHVYAYAGKLLRVDLTNERISYEPTAQYAREWLGGSGVGQWILYNEVKPWVGPYAPANRLIIGSGALSGTLAPRSSRTSADSKNGLTLGVGSSNSCGRFAPELKFAGYDSIIFQGKARKPVYLWIKDERVEIRDASHLWGKNTWETEDIIRHELGDDNTQLIAIGPAGENIVRGACIILNKGRALGRCGLGGVMGSKNLKAVAARGSGAVEVADPARFMRAVDQALLASEQNERVKLDREYGTVSPGALIARKESDAFIYKNFQYMEAPDEFIERLDLENLNKKYRVRNVGYMACPVACGRYFRINDGPYAGLTTKDAQFEALQDFAGKLGVSDPTFFIKANSYCNQMGIDIDSAAGSIGWAMECYQRGILKESDTDGLKLEWGDAGVILELIRKIAYREGFGNILGEGCAHAADLLGRGSEYFAMHLKGQDLYEPLRLSAGYALGVVTSTRGGGHTTGAPALERFYGKDNQEEIEKLLGLSRITSPRSYEGKAEMVVFTEQLDRINNSLGICRPATACLNPDLLGFPEIAELYSAATGWETTGGDLKRAATRMLNVEKAFNLLHTNLGRKDDYPPRRCLEEPIPTGSAKGVKLDKEKWDNMLDEYYEMHDWDKKTSFPTRKCLENLDLGRIADDLEKIGKLGST